MEEEDAPYVINYFKSDDRVVSERHLCKLADARELVARAVADGSAERAQVREAETGKVIYSR